MTVLRNHFSGEGNATRRFAEVDRFKDTLHYKNIKKCKHRKGVIKDAKIRFLLKKNCTVA